jgi:hypothetical protein
VNIIFRSSADAAPFSGYPAPELEPGDGADVESSLPAECPKDPAGRKPPTGWRSRYGPIPRAGAVCAACVRYKRKRLQPRRTGAVSLSAPERPDALVSPGPLRAASKSLQQMRRTKSPAVTPGHRKYPFQVMQCLRLSGRKRGVCAQPDIATSGGAKSNLRRLPNTAGRGIRNKRGRSDLKHGPTKVSGLHGPTPIAPHPVGPCFPAFAAFLPSKRSAIPPPQSGNNPHFPAPHVERPQPLGERAEASADLGA